MSHLIEMSNITTRANNQFPRPDFHRLDKQPYRLQPLVKGGRRRRRRGCLARPEGQDEMVAPFEIRCAEGEVFPMRKTTPERLRDHCRCAATPFN